MDKIIIKGARENNLKNIDIELPKNKLIVMTGLSGSGKSFIEIKWLYENRNKKCLLLTSQKPIIDQIIRHIESCGLTINDFPTAINPNIIIPPKKTTILHGWISDLVMSISFNPLVIFLATSGKYIDIGTVVTEEKTVYIYWAIE